MDHNVRESTLAVSAMRDHHHHHHHDEGQRDQRSSSATEAAVVKLAGIAIRFNVRLRSSDMPPHMQEHAMRRTRSLLDSSRSSPPPPTTTTTTDSKPTRPNPTHLARALKQEFDSLYGPAWHCVIGASFGSFVTHSAGGFMYFSIDSLSVLLFKTQVLLVAESTRQNIIS